MLSQPPLVSLNAEGEISRRRAFRKWELTSARFPSRVYPVGIFPFGSGYLPLDFFPVGSFPTWVGFPPGWGFRLRDSSAVSQAGIQSRVLAAASAPSGSERDTDRGLPVVENILPEVSLAEVDVPDVGWCGGE